MPVDFKWRYYPKDQGQITKNTILELRDNIQGIADMYTCSTHNTNAGTNSEGYTAYNNITDPSGCPSTEVNNFKTDHSSECFLADDTEYISDYSGNNIGWCNTDNSGFGGTRYGAEV